MFQVHACNVFLCVFSVRTIVYLSEAYFPYVKWIFSNKWVSQAWPFVNPVLIYVKYKKLLNNSLVVTDMLSWGTLWRAKQWSETISLKKYLNFPRKKNVVAQYNEKSDYLCSADVFITLCCWVNKPVYKLGHLIGCCTCNTSVSFR